MVAGLLAVATDAGDARGSAGAEEWGRTEHVVGPVEIAVVDMEGGAVLGEPEGVVEVESGNVGIAGDDRVKVATAVADVEGNGTGRSGRLGSSVAIAVLLPPVAVAVPVDVARGRG